MAKESINLNLFGRLAFTDNRETRVNELIHGDKDGKKLCKLLVAPGDAPAGCASLQQLQGAFMAAGKKEFGENVDWSAVKMSLKDGNKCKNKETGQIYAGHENMWSLGVSSRFPFSFVTKPAGSANTVLVPQEQLEAKFYSGAWVVMNIAIQAGSGKDDKTGATFRYVTAYIQSILWVKDDDALGGGGTDPNSAFEGLAGFEYTDPAPDASGFGAQDNFGAAPNNGAGNAAGSDSFFGGGGQEQAAPSSDPFG